MAEIVWLRRSLLDLLDIEAEIATFDPPAGARISHRIQLAGESLSEFPNRGRPAFDTVRVLTTVPPYLLYYEVIDATVYILTIRHGRRRPLNARQS